MRLRSAAPAFLVSDVAATMEWYQTVLGFDVHPFPRKPPYVFAIVERDGVEIMLQALPGYQKPDVYPQRSGGVWNVYLRMEGVHELWDALSARGDVTIVEPICKQPYGDTEFVIRDPNGYVLVLSELITKSS